MDAFTEHADGLWELQNEQGGACPTFTWKGQTIRVLPGGAQRSNELEAGGLAVDADLSLTCLASSFSYDTTEEIVAALGKSQLTYQGNLYRVESVTVAPGAKQLTIKATDLNKGA